MPVYYPSARVRLKLRTEEFQETAELVRRLPPALAETPESGTQTPPTSQPSTTTPDDSAAEALARNTEQRTQLERRRSAISADEFNRQIAQLDEERAAIMRQNAAQTPEGEGQAPEAVAGTTTDDLTVVGEIEPVTATIEYNGLSTADTASVTIDYHRAPIDPRLLRSAHIEITIGLVSADDYEAGMERGRERPDGSRTSLVSRDDGGTVARFVGFIDEWDVEYSDAGDTVKLTCRDMSATLQDTKLPAGVSINLDLPLDQGVADLLNRASASTRGVTVRYVGEGTAPTPADSAPPPPPRAQVGAAGAAGLVVGGPIGGRGPRGRRRPRRNAVGRRARRSGQEMTLWDHITDVVRCMGLLPMFVGYELLIADPRTLYTTESTRRMIYGRNLSSLRFTRKLQGVKVPTIEVRCVDHERGRTLWARYPEANGQPSSGVMGVDNPPAPSRANVVPPSGSNPDEDVRRMLVSGITDPERLGQIARSIYDEIGRQEIEGTFATNDVWSYDSTPEAPDLLTMRPGDAVTLLVAQTEAGGEEVGSDTSLARIQTMDRNRRIGYMTSLGWTRAVAARFADLQEASGFQTTFRVRDVRLNWDHSNGLELTCDFINYIVVREQQEVDMDFSTGEGV